MAAVDGPGSEAPPRAPTLPRRAWAGGLLGTVIAVAGYSFLRALEDQLGRLGSPGASPAHRSFAHLHGAHPEVALRTWNGGVATLAELTPVTPQVLIRVHAAVGVLVVVAAAATLVASAEALRNRATAHPPGVVVRGGLALAAAAAVVAQLVEALCEAALANANAGGRILVRDDIARYAPWFDVTAAMKAGGLGLAAAMLVLVAVRTGAVRRAARALVAAPAAHKTTLLAGMVFASLVLDGDRGAQSEDLLRRELDARGLLSWAPNVIVLVVLLFLVDQVRRLDATPADRDAPARGWQIAAAGGALAVVGVVVARTVGGASLAVLGALVLLYGVVTVLAERSADDPTPLPSSTSTPSARSSLLAVAAALPPGGLAVLCGRLLAGEVAIQRSWVPLAVVEVGLLAVAAGAVLLLSRPRPLLARAVTGRVVAGLVLAVVAVVAAGSWGNPGLGSDVGRGAGTIAVLLFALALVPALGVVLRPVAHRLGRPAAVRATARTPVVAIGVIWFLLAASVGGVIEDADHSPHLVRTTERTTDVPGGPCGGLRSEEAATVAAALGPAEADEPVGAAAARGRLCRWIVHNAGPASRIPGTGAVPLLLVAASGGGVRAATWTATVLECLLLRGEGAADRCGSAGPGAEPDPTDAWPLLFAAGGASGGSVGVASATAQRIAPLEDEDELRPDEDWLRRLATRDHVGPVVTRMALVEGPMGWTGWQPGIDRAEVLADSWSEPFGPIATDRCRRLGDRRIEDVGFISLAHACVDQVPALLLNGTVVATGQRFDGSPLGPLHRPGETLDPSGEHVTDDPVALRDALCSDDDVPFFDVAFASSRFPFVTPSVRFPGAGRDDCADGTVGAVDVVDGGYRENSGAGQVLDLVRALTPALGSYARDVPDGFRPVVPLLVEIENGEGKGDDGVVHDGATGAVAEAAGPDVGPHGADADTRTGLAEPARVPLAAWNVHVRGRPDDGAREALRDAVALIEGGRTVRLALARHPGRALPLGWSLTDAIVDDMEVVMRLCPNQRALDSVWSAIEGTPVTTVPAACRPRGERPRAGRWR